MKKIRSSAIGEFAFLIAILICVYFFIHVISIGVNFNKDIGYRGAERAEIYIDRQGNYVKEICDEYIRESDFLAMQVERYDSVDKLESFLSNYKNDSFLAKKSVLKTICYVSDNSIYDISVAKSADNSVNYAELNELIGVTESRISKIFQYGNNLMSVAAYSAVDSNVCDGLLLVYDIIDLKQYLQNADESVKDIFGLTDFSALCKFDGIIIDEGNTGYIRERLFNRVFNKSEEIVGDVEKALMGSEIKSFLYSKSSERYVLCVNPFGVKYGGLSLVCAYSLKSVFGDGYATMQTIWSSIIGLGVVSGIMIAFFVISTITARRKEYQREMINPTLNCSTLRKFENDSGDLIKRNHASDFAFVSIKVTNFGFFLEKIGDDETLKLIKGIDSIVRHALQIGETYAYDGEGAFYLLLHFKNKQLFNERLKLVYLKITSLNQMFKGDYKIVTSLSVYEVEKGVKQTVKKMLDKLDMVEGITSTHASSLTINYYDEMMRENFIKRAEIEGRMEHALENSEFHLFYQPKFNLHTHNMDGSEILIRWYDPEIEKYHLPGEFLPVFEENGFISKLDRFVLYKACENIAGRIAKRQICYPISVNVSRVTAAQSDFLEYYVRIKNKFNIKDNFITLEFTESFAYENYETLQNLVEKLHENGFLCSIDDFGTGYSSYNILKTLPMDEIKLDKFFLKKGRSEECDRLLLKSVIDMLKAIGSKVTQEGVETKEELHLLESFGCDVIQGFYFSKPLKYVDYCTFIEKNFINK